eukprot:2146621-Pleurochrysis_carterae.AAC.1
MPFATTNDLQMVDEVGADGEMSACKDTAETTLCRTSCRQRKSSQPLGDHGDTAASAPTPLSSPFSSPRLRGLGGLPGRVPSISFSITNLEELGSLSPVLKEEKRISVDWGFSRSSSAEDVTFSLCLSASEQNLVGRGIAAIPCTETRPRLAYDGATHRESENEPGAARKQVRRVFTVRVNRRGRCDPNARQGVCCALLFCKLLPIVGAALVVALGVAAPRYLRGTMAIHTKAPRAAVAGPSAAWTDGLNLEYARAAALDARSVSQLAPALRDVVSYEMRMLQRCTQAQSGALGRAAHKQLERLRAQLSPLSQLGPCAVAADDGDVPAVAVAAAGLAFAAASVLTRAQPSPPPLQATTGAATAATAASANGRVQAQAGQSQVQDSFEDGIEGSSVSGAPELSTQVADACVHEVPGSEWTARGVPGGCAANLHFSSASASLCLTQQAILM